LPGWITREEVAGLSRGAREEPRRRKNRNLHAMEDPVHRLLNAVEPGTYVRPHRHAHPARSETIVALAGRIGLILFDAEGRLLDRRALDNAGETLGADLPPEAWHTVVALEPGSVFFETKGGPYVPAAGDDVAVWAPPEGSPEAAALERSWRALFTEE
jgi:cupin fold WbuC family metalloprotein